MLFFVPVGYSGAALLPARRSWLAITVGVVVSACIEGHQGVFLTGRVASMADLTANSAGAVIGFLVVFALRLRIRHRDGLVILDVLQVRRATDGRPERPGLLSDPEHR